MSKLRELVYDVITRVNELSDNSDFSEAYIVELINQQRATYLSREYSKRKIISIDYRQTIVADVELRNATLDEDIRFTRNSVIRTVEQLPKILSLNSIPAIYQLSTLERNLGEFDFVDKNRAKWAKSAKFCPLSTYLDTDERLYLISSKESIKLLKWVGIDAVFEDPREALRFSYPDKSETELYELENYPISKKVWKYMKEDIVSELIGNKVTPADIQQQSADMPLSPLPTQKQGEYSYNTNTRLGL